MKFFFISLKTILFIFIALWLFQQEQEEKFSKFTNYFSVYTLIDGKIIQMRKENLFKRIEIWLEITAINRVIHWQVEASIFEAIKAP